MPNDTTPSTARTRAEAERATNNWQESAYHRPVTPRDWLFVMAVALLLAVVLLAGDAWHAEPAPLVPSLHGTEPTRVLELAGEGVPE